MKKIVCEISDFIFEVTSSKGIDVDDCSRLEIDKYISGDIDYYNDEFRDVAEEIKDELGMVFSENESYLIYLQGEKIRWSRPEQKSREGYLSGGFYINGILDMFLYSTEFWKGSVENFSSLGCVNLVDTPDNIRWFESTAAFNGPEDTPHFGCVKLEPPLFPNKFYFYDSGLLFPLSFSSFEEYFLAMIQSAAVRCWQYFYIKPENIIKKSSGLSYITWALHTDSYLDERIQSLVFDDSIQHDRLDLIDEYLERCVRLLPESFPFLDFSHHQEYYKNFRRARKLG